MSRSEKASPRTIYVGMMSCVLALALQERKYDHVQQASSAFLTAISSLSGAVFGME